MADALAELDVERIVAPNPGPFTLEGTNTWLVGREPCWVVDPGPAEPTHLAALREAVARRGGEARLALTHSHADHADAVDELDWPLRQAGDGERLGPFRVLATPGHSPDHVCLLLDTACLCGDLILGQGSSIVGTEPGALAAYLDSLRRLREQAPTLLLPGHGPPIADPLAKIDEYIAHRLDRERRLLAALRRGERSRERLLAEVWDDVPAQLRPAAAVVMEVHLDKLRDEGRLPAEPQDPSASRPAHPPEA